VKTEIVVVGGGLSGLVTAYELSKRNIDFQLLEARTCFGGRIMPLKSRVSSASFDLGPSWFWPAQSNIYGLINELGLANHVFEQPSSGDSIYEPIGSPIQRAVLGISMAGSYRLQGGIYSLVSSLIERITELGYGDRLHLSSAVSKIERTQTKIALTLKGGCLECERVVLALPARVALEHIEFAPKLEKERVTALKGVATWMAGHAKAVVEYPEPFWSNMGYSGDVLSQLGPLSEVHDASSQIVQAKKVAIADTAKSTGFALSGFLGLDPETRERNSEQLPNLILEQLSRLFGVEMMRPINIHIQDWAREPYTATKQDQKLLNHKVLNSRVIACEPGWAQALIWSGTEAVNDHSNGYLEGAVLASQRTVKQLEADC
jgi:monoamine oxidase